MPADTRKACHVAIVTCSTRSPRLNPFISQFIFQTFQSSQSDTTIRIIDLQDQALPLYDEPAVPSHLPSDDPTPHYTNEHTRRWSTTVRQYDAFIFVTPQYNWSIPASLKNALDYLFYEWKGKPAAIVAYGGKGGGKAAEHLRQILTGLRMQVVESTAQLTLSSKTMEECLKFNEVSSSDKLRWRADGMEAKLEDAFRELTRVLQDG